MEDLGDYIYLIAIVIAGLSSLLGKKKRKPLQTEMLEDDMPDLDDVIPEYQTSYDPFVITEAVVPPPTVRHVASSPSNYKKASEFTKLSARKTVKMEPSKVILDASDTSRPEDHYNVEFETMEDVKRAIVYAEIFNRKY
jgi:hypothetical protein